MIDRALIGAIERAFERNEPKEFMRLSLINSGYSPQDVDEAINLVTYRKQQAPAILPQITEKKEKLQSSTNLVDTKKKHFDKSIIIISALSLVLLAFITFYLYIRKDVISCRNLGLASLRKHVFGIAVNCNQLSIIQAETFIAFFTTLVLLGIIIFLYIKRR